MLRRPTSSTLSSSSAASDVYKRQDLKNGSEAEKAELQKQINSLKEQLNEANAKVTVLKAEKERLTEEKTSLQTELKKAQEDAAKKKAEEAEALKKAQEEEQKAKEELQKLKDAMTLKTGDTITVKGVTYRVTNAEAKTCLLYTSPSPRDGLLSRMPSSA